MTTFQDLNLIGPLQEAIAEEGYQVPTPIQEMTIPPAMEGLDILGCAQTGTGKTAAFALPMLNLFAGKSFKAVAKRPLGLVLAPTRELAIQIGASFDAYGRHVDVSHALVYGGVGQGRQVQAIEHGVHVLIATPGRLLDLMGQEFIFLNRLQIFVLDEADRMLDMGFLPDLKQIIKSLPIRRQSMFFSATMPHKIVQLSQKLLHHPVSVDVAPKKTNVELIDQRVIFAEHAQKKPLLLKLITAGDVGQAIVFTKTKRGANFVAEYLRRNKIDAVAIHGNKSQNARQQALDAFRADKVQILVATDLASRGIDVDGISHVFNFEMPIEPEAYIHRIGRTGRAGATGIAISLCSPGERNMLKSIERLIGFEILEDGREPEPLPPSAERVRPDDDDDDSSTGRRNRRRRRTRGPRRPPATTANPSDEVKRPIMPPLAPPRPTAATRKNARNRRRGKGSSPGEE
ncbi:MAG: DEAD/DEAH box helicase [Planctomycetaceae bacterium]